MEQEPFLFLLVLPIVLQSWQQSWEGLWKEAGEQEHFHCRRIRLPWWSPCASEEWLICSRPGITCAHPGVAPTWHPGDWRAGVAGLWNFKKRIRQILLTTIAEGRVLGRKVEFGLWGLRHGEQEEEKREKKGQNRSKRWCDGDQTGREILISCLRWETFQRVV